MMRSASHHAEVASVAKIITIANISAQQKYTAVPIDCVCVWGRGGVI